MAKPKPKRRFSWKIVKRDPVTKQFTVQANYQLCQSPKWELNEVCGCGHPRAKHFVKIQMVFDKTGKITGIECLDGRTFDSSCLITFCEKCDCRSFLTDNLDWLKVNRGNAL